MDAGRRSAWTLAAFAAALDLALVVCTYGFVSLFTGAEPVADGEAGPLVGPVSVAASVTALLLHLARALRTPGRVLGSVLLAALWTWLAAVVAAIVAFAIVTGGVTPSVFFGLGFGIGPFGLLIPASAALVAWLAHLVAGAQQGGADRPRWPWERDDEE